jgi:hypothetical protein
MFDPYDAIDLVFDIFNLMPWRRMSFWLVVFIVVATVFGILWWTEAI